MLKRILGLLILVLGLSSGAVRPSVAADDVADFYHGRTINGIVVFELGGLYGLYAHLITEHIGKHIPGHPTVILQQMTGAGGLKGTNYLYNAAPKDGTVIGMIVKDAAVTQMLAPEKIKYDVRHFQWIGRVAPFVTVLYVTDRSPAKTIEEAKQVEVVLGATGRSAASYQQPILLNNLAGTRFKVITGYRGGSGMTLAAERGETNGWSGAGLTGYLSGRNWDLIQQKKIFLMMQTGTKRNAQFPDVPLLSELAKDADAKRIIKLIDSGTDLGMSFAAPPGVPADRIAALRAAFDATVKDPALLADAKKLSLPVDSANWKELTEIVNEPISMPAPIVARARQILGF